MLERVQAYRTQQSLELPEDELLPRLFECLDIDKRDMYYRMPIQTHTHTFKDTQKESLLIDFLVHSGV